MTTEESRAEEIRIMSLPEMQKKFREAMGPVIEGDCYWHPVFGAICWISNDEQAERANKLKPYPIIPLPIDPVNPERGCEGMLQGALILRRNFGTRDWYLTVTTGNDIQTYRGETPTLALLRALAAQWNVEVDQ